MGFILFSLSQSFSQSILSNPWKSKTLLILVIPAPCIITLLQEPMAINPFLTGRSWEQRKGAVAWWHVGCGRMNHCLAWQENSKLHESYAIWACSYTQASSMLLKNPIGVIRFSQNKNLQCAHCIFLRNNFRKCVPGFWEIQLVKWNIGWCIGLKLTHFILISALCGPS